MLKTTQVFGIDPGLVHTGVVEMYFTPSTKSVIVRHAVFGPPGADTQAVLDLQQWIDTARSPHPNYTFIEGYKPRGNLGGDQKMVAAVAAIKQATGGKTLLNYGVKKVVKRALMELLGVWAFTTVTHHQDLRAAARIGIFGMLKDEELNKIITQVVTDHLDGRTWSVTT